jgi:YD repeat-containing protein
MPGKKIIPAYRFHKQTGRAITTMYDANGQRKSILLPGKYESQESRKEYKRLLNIVTANDGALPKQEKQAKLTDSTVNELCVRYLEHAESYYVDPVTRTPTSEQDAIREAIKPLVRMYGSTLVKEFDSLALEAVQLAMATGSYLTGEERAKKIKGNRPLGLARTTTNQCINRIRRIWRWGCSKKIVPADCLASIESLASLKQGRSVARETEIVAPW